jgi:hypothetical protein
VSVGVGGIVASSANDTAADGAEPFPAASVARARTACRPGATETGSDQSPFVSLVTLPAATPSSSSSTRAPGSAVPENGTCASTRASTPRIAPSAGNATTGTSGARRSTSTVTGPATVVLPAASRTETEAERVPSAAGAAASRAMGTRGAEHET